MKNRIYRAIWLLLFAPAITQAQNNVSIDELVITARSRPSRVEGPALVLDNEDLRERQPVAVADIFRNLTGMSMRTNSRGDAVVRIRGAEERQTLVFLDGAPLATPWDGRTDLSLLPAGLIDRIEVTRGIAPVEYGANAIAGAIDLVTHVPEEGQSLRAELQQGSLGLQNLNAVFGVGADNDWSFVAGAAKLNRDADRIADKASVEFDPSTTDSRTNTDFSSNSQFAALGYSGNRFFLRASILHADVDRGIAAQGNLDPDTSGPRFWRIPDWQLTQATLNGDWHLAQNVNLRFTGWQQWLDQTIDAYQDYSYDALQAREQGQDRTTGGRLVLSLDADRTTFRLVATAQDSTHLQLDSETATGDAADLVAEPAQRYRQQLSTLGLEADWRIATTLTTTFGIGYDHAATPLTGDKPAQESLSAPGWSAGLRWTPMDQWTVAATLGQRSRFPTPREMYGVALGRFLLNPELQPERSVLADLSASYSDSDALFLDVSLWANKSVDTLSQQVVTVGNSNRRQRYNTDGSFTYGVEASAVLAITERLRSELSVALQNGEAERAENGERPILIQRPDAQFNLALDWQASPRLDLRAELTHVGRAYDLADDGAATRLPASTSVNLRGFFDLGRLANQDIMLTAAIDNLTDTLVLPQLGLPAPGRSFHVGIRIN